MAEHHVLREGVVEHTETGTNNRLALPGQIPRSTHARSEVFVVGIVEAGQSRLADLGQRESSGSWRR